MKIVMIFIFLISMSANGFDLSPILKCEGNFTKQGSQFSAKFEAYRDLSGRFEVYSVKGGKVAVCDLRPLERSGFNVAQQVQTSHIKYDVKKLCRYIVKEYRFLLKFMPTHYLNLKKTGKDRISIHYQGIKEIPPVRCDQSVSFDEKKYQKFMERQPKKK
jgi:hypothetical protein